MMTLLLPMFHKVQIWWENLFAEFHKCYLNLFSSVFLLSVTCRNDHFYCIIHFIVFAYSMYHFEKEMCIINTHHTSKVLFFLYLDLSKDILLTTASLTTCIFISCRRLYHSFRPSLRLIPTLFPSKTYFHKCIPDNKYSPNEVLL